MINARQLEVLTTVIEVGTTLRAAELLGVSQPAVSNMIRHTEDLIGITLFERAKGRLVPTKEARLIAQEAQHLFMQQKRVSRIVREIREGSRGSLTIAASPSLGLGLVPRVIGEFATGAPQLRVSLELGSIDVICDMLASGQADIGFALTQPRHPAVSHEAVGAGEMVCVCPPGHPFARMRRIGVADLNQVPHISYSAATPLGQMIDRVFAEKGLERRYAFEVRHTATALEMVAAGLGVALVDSFGLIGRRADNLERVAVEPSMPIRINAMMPRLFPTSSLAISFLDRFRTVTGAAG
ncbi:LysR family transcriptional regulator [Paralimibaculum aggregatum]|uniref:LysR family transcriptional regulator n=1 Tax=Paralimibaculum aggregatum TaxID=3036245 RepID=A0ABQ6LDZ8_9RHOB|nr:LysR family transcriptional regulator [Limibaculum sp. NKW23]GMG81573.1 LysR family transcriptional regulator [Limibaculum sp. NKW23]